MKSLILIAAFCLFTVSSKCQTVFQRSLGTDSISVAWGIDITSDGGYVVTGLTWVSFSQEHDVILVKFNAEGDTLWSKTYGGLNYDQGLFVQQTFDDGYIITGFTRSPGVVGWTDVYLIKTDSNGDTLWTRTYGGLLQEIGWAVKQTADSGYVIVGTTENFGAGGLDVYLIRTDANGDTLWTKTYGGAGNENDPSVDITTDGGFIIAGVTGSFGAGWGDVYLIRTDNNGDTLWTKVYGGSVGSDYAKAVKQTTDGGYIIAGTSWSFGITAEDYYLIKTDSLGDTLWTRTYGGPMADMGWDVIEAMDGGYVIVGQTRSFGAVGGDAYLVKTDVNGNLLWSKTYGGDQTDAGQFVLETADGGYVLSGVSYSWIPGGNVSGDGALYLVKTDSLGNSGCYETSPPTLMQNTTTIVGSTSTIVGSGAMMGNAIIIVDNIAFTDSVICTNVGINESFISNHEIAIYPNPATSFFTIQGSFAFPAVLELYDLTGRRVFQQPVTSNRQQVDVDKFANGLYIYRLLSHGKVARGKIILE